MKKGQNVSWGALNFSTGLHLIAMSCQVRLGSGFYNMFVPKGPYRYAIDIIKVVYTVDLIMANQKWKLSEIVKIELVLVSIC